MSDANGPVSRRRIAGESKPAAPAKKAPAKKSAKKPVAPVGRPAAVKKAAKAASAKKAPTPTVTAPAKKAPTAKRVPAAKEAAASTSPAAATAPKKTAAPSVARTPVVPATPAPQRSTSGSSGTPGLRRLVPAVLVAVVALVAGVLLMVQGVKQVTGGEDFGPSQEQASSAAGSAAETIFSFRYDQLDEHLTASKALMTPSFAKEFDKIAPALTELAPQRKIVVEAVSRDAAPLSCGDECSSTKATILVFVDQARLVGGSDKPTVFANRISVSMVKTADGWLVNNIRAL